MMYFDFESIARDAAISDEDLQRIVRLARQEFPHDDMMADLHILRTCLAVRDGLCTLQQAISTSAA